MCIVSTPDIPEPPPPPRPAQLPDEKEAARLRERRLLQGTGRTSTILTTPHGLQE